MTQETSWNNIRIEYTKGKLIRAQTPSCVYWICAYCRHDNWQTDATCFKCNHKRAEIR